MKIIDLSGEYTEKMWYYGEPYTPYSVKDLACVDKNGYIAREYTLTAHTGTHIENSAHWSENAQRISETPIEKFAGNARLLYLTFSESKEITVKRLKAAGADDLEKDEICIIRTNWDSFWNKKEYVSESPYITVPAAEYLVSKGIKLVGMDSPMIGDPNDGISSVGADLVLPDYKFSEAGIPIILGLVNLSSLPEKFFFTAFPLKLHNGEGSPCRATAITF